MAAMSAAGARVRSPLFPHGRRSSTGPTATDRVCRAHARASVLVGSASDTLGTIILNSVLVISVAVRAVLAGSTATATSCAR